MVMTAAPWPLVPLEHIALGGPKGIADGPFGSAVKEADYQPAGVPILRGGNLGLGDCRLRLENLVFISEALAKKHSRAIAVPGDVVFTKKGTIGSVGIIPADTGYDRFLVSSNQMKATIDPQVAAALFVYYVFASASTRERLVRESSATGVPKINLAYLRTFLVPAPPLDEQRRIAALLGALDDKIELNRKMNRTLEEMAQALFRSWFIDFDGHNDLVASEMGPIPRGWAATKLGDVVEIYDNLRVPLSSLQRSGRQGIYPYHGATSVMDHVDSYLFDGIYVLVGEDGSVVDDNDRPMIQYVWGKFWVNNHAHVLLPKSPVGTEHLLIALKNVNIRPFVTGAVQLKINQQNLKRVPFLLPSQDACQRFTSAVAPLYAKMRASSEESATLTNLRDTLLPKLISGELRIPEAEALIP